MGKAMMGTGEGDGDSRAVASAEAAISNPLLDDVSMRGARGVLINITGGPDMTLFEVDEAANRIRDEVDPDANIIFGSTFDESLEGTMRVSVVATGIDVEEARQPRPVTLSVVKTETEAKPAEAPAADEAAKEDVPAAAKAETKQPQDGGELDTGDLGGAELSDSLVEKDEDESSGGVEFALGESEEEEEAPAAAKAEDADSDEQAGGEPELPEDAFVAPPAAKAPPRYAAEPKPDQADAFAAADLANAASRPEGEPRSRRNKAYSLFARVTGAAKAMQPEKEDAHREEPRRDEPRLDKPARPSEPRKTASGGGAASAQAVSSQAATAAPAAQQTSASSATAPAGVPSGAPAPGGAATAAAVAEPEPTPEPTKPEPAKQQNLRGFEDTRAQRRAQSEEDELDIPAFLRRQAN
jgi:cell division protein FtsZ